jgi:hypothetical protein
VLALAVAFVTDLLLIERRYEGRADGAAIIATAAAIAVAVFAAVTLSGEGIVYAAANPSRVLVSRSLLSFLAAGLAGTGVGYRTVGHWREFAGDASASGRL